VEIGQIYVNALKSHVKCDNVNCSATEDQIFFY